MRTEEIRIRLSGYVRDDLGCKVGTTPKAEWLAWPLPGHLRFGWMPPIKVTEDDGESLMVLFSPELMAEVMADLTDDQFEDIFTLIEFVLARHVEHIEEPLEEVTGLIEAELYDKVPSILKMRYEVEARALGTVVPQR